MDPSNPINLAYYDCNTGFLINGTFQYSILSIIFVTYTIFMVATNAKALPSINLVSPSAPIYYESFIPVEVTNSTSVDSVWFRNSTDGGSSWSANLSLSYDGISFKNTSVLDWDDGTYILQVFANNTDNITIFKTHNFQVLTTGPNIQILSPINTTYFYGNIPLIVQNLTYVDSLWYRFYNGTIWSGNSTVSYNGTYFLDDTIYWTDGTYQVQVFANDTSGEIAQRQERFGIDQTLPINLTANSITDLIPRTVIDSNGVVHAAWIKNSSNTYEIIYGNNSNRHSNSFISVFSSAGMLFNLNMVIDPADIIHLCWIEIIGANIEIYYVNNSKGTFGSPYKIPLALFTIYREVSLAVAPTGKVYMALTGVSFLGNGLFYTDDSAGFFTAPIPVYTHASNYYTTPAITVDSNSIVHIFWTDNSTGNEDIFHTDNSGGSFLLVPQQISTHSDRDIAPATTIDSSDVVHLTWMVLTNNQWDIMYANISGGSLSTPKNLTGNSLDPDFYPRITVDPALTPDAVYIAWVGVAGGKLQPFNVDNRKGDFCAPRTFYDISVNTSYVDIAVHPYEGLIYLLWSGDDTADQEVYYTQDYQPITLLSPGNITYTYRHIPLQIINSSRHLTQVWCRNRTNTGNWSSNYTLSWDGTYFSNSSTVFWPAGSMITVEIFSNDSKGQVFSKYEYFGIDNSTPRAYQWENTTSKYIQMSTPIWINGTAWDPPISTGVSSITIIQSNTSGGIADWSSNVGDLNNFAFYNTSPLVDNQLQGCYEINISIVDGVGRSTVLTSNITVEINPPYGSQDPATNLSNPQNTQTIWVNGTAFDDGFGVANVIIQFSNYTNWSTNQGSLNAWSFSNTTPINEGIWFIQINVTDYTNKSTLINCYIQIKFGDVLPPTGSQSPSTNVSNPQNGDENSFIWVNGTASDDTGVQLVFIQQTNHTGMPWSANIGTNESWAFNNVSTIADGTWEIQVNITDFANNSAIVYCYILVDTI
ncbi:MAG: TolB family protein, partial [Candidatus Helarchaeota archaeon]